MTVLRTVALCGFALVACTSGVNDDQSGGDGGAAVSDGGMSATDAYVGEGIPWKDKDFLQRVAYMEVVVFPTMSALFIELDAERFGEMSCETCHGPDPGENDYEMPSGTLPDLPIDDKPEEEQFMEDVVLPTMLDLLEAEPFDRDTGTGFGCRGCHGE